MNDKPNYLTDTGGGTGVKTPGPVRPEGRRSFLALMIFFLVIFAIAIVVWLRHIYMAWDQSIGDGRNVATYQFDVSNFTGDRSVLVASGAPKDNIQAIVNPTMIQAAEKEEAARGWARVVTTDDIVIGVVIDGEARAYPLRYVQWHEIVNDMVKGVPVAVTYNKLCDAAVVFDRRVGDTTLTFGYSGLLYNSNLVMYDDQASNEAESLWPQLGFEAMSGPLVGTELKVLPMYLGRWDGWVEQHPQTLVWGGEKHYRERYNKRVILPGYFERGELKFPVKPLPPEESPLKWMDRVVALGSQQGWMVWPVESLVFADGKLTLPQGARATFTLTRDGATGPMLGGNATVHACWFAWYAFHGDEELVAPAEQTPASPAAK